MAGYRGNGLGQLLSCGMIFLTMLIVSPQLTTGTGCIFERQCLLDYYNPYSLPDVDMAECDNSGAALFGGLNFTSPVNPTTSDYYNELFCTYQWQVDADHTIHYSFDSFRTVAPYDDITVFAGTNMYVHSGTSIPAPVYTGGNSLSAYFVTDNDGNTDEGFKGKLYSAPAGNSRRRRSAEQLSIQRQPVKSVTRSNPSHHRDYNGRIEDVADIPELVHLLRKRGAKKITNGELCDYSCSARRLVRMEECCKYWYENDISPKTCQYDADAAQLPDGGLCSAEHPLDKDERKRRRYVPKHRLPEKRYETLLTLFHVVKRHIKKML